MYANQFCYTFKIIQNKKWNLLTGVSLYKIVQVLFLFLTISNAKLYMYIYSTLCFIRLERVKIKELRSQAKVIGTLVSFAGALLMTLYKGPQVHLFHNPNTTHQESGNHSTQSHQHWIAGTLFIGLGCLAWSSFYILQVTY